MRAACNIVGFCLALAMGGCALAVNGAPPQTYDLVPPNIAAVSGQPMPVHIVVRTPTAVRALDNERILVRPASERISYYPDAVWGDRLPRLLRARIVETLEDSGHFKAVVTEEDRVSGSYSLQIAVRAFEMSVNGKPPEGHVDLAAKIVDERVGEVIASRRLESRVQAQSDAVADGVAAITTAFHRVSRELVGWMTSGSQRSRLGAGS